jgi:hypothetical protein
MSQKFFKKFETNKESEVNLEKTAEEILRIILKQVEAETNMADFNVDSALKMPTLATVDSDNIRDFLNTIEAFNETIKTSDKKIFIKFITRTKITGVLGLFKSH